MAIETQSAGSTPKLVNELPAIDGQSHTWRRVELEVKKALAGHRAALEILGTPPDETEGHRYAIRALEEILNLRFSRQGGHDVFTPELSPSARDTLGGSY